MRQLKALAAPLFASVLTALLVSGLANSAVHQWSQTASTNASVDPSINWAEGQSPSSVNDSGRAMMAAVARYRDDISAVNSTGGTSSAYTLVTSSTYPANPTGLMVGFRVHATNADNATLTIDGGTTYQIQTSLGVNVVAGTLIANSPYTALHNGAAWVLRDFYGSPYAVPIGALIPFTGDTSPNASFVLPAGQAISRTTYATYFAMVGTRFGVGDGSTTFNVPDLRGRVVAGIDNLGGSAASRLTTTYLGGTSTTVGAVGGSDNRALITAELPAHTHPSPTLTDPGHFHTTSNVFLGNSYATGPDNTSITALNAPTNADTNTKTTGITLGANTGSAGSGTAHSIVQPTMVVSYLLRVL